MMLVRQLELLRVDPKSPFQQHLKHRRAEYAGTAIALMNCATKSGHTSQSRTLVRGSGHQAGRLSLQTDSHTPRTRGDVAEL